MPVRSPASLRVPLNRLRRAANPAIFKFKTTAEIPPLEGTVGQDRAVQALDFGLSIEAEGFNVFLAGPTGTGRETELRTQLERIARERPAPSDWCYVFNFADPARPRALRLPPDRGHQLAHDIDDLIAAVRREVPKAFESDEYAQRRDQINREVQAQRERMFEALQKEATARSMTINVTPMGITTIPVLDGKPLTKEQYDLLTDERRHEIQQHTADLDSIIAQFVPQLRRLDRAVAQLLAELDRQVMIAIASPMIDEIKRDYAREEEVLEYLDQLREDIVENIHAFRGIDEQEGAIPGLAPLIRENLFNRYKVNVIVTHAADAHAPIVFEDSPSYYRMFGRIDYKPQFGAMTTDHMMIKPGALHRANGGFLAVHALDVLSQPLVWETLKRALNTRQARLENLGEQFSILPTATLSPEPIPLDVKVAMIGNQRIFTVLQQVDEDFKKLFKAKADFTIDVARDESTQQAYASFIARQCEKLGMRPFDRGAVARIIEQSSRMAGDQEKLSLRLLDIVDLLVEADYWTCDGGSPAVTAEYVDKAIERKIYRSNLIEERIQELINNGTIKVDTDGAVVGQVNGLSVYDLGDYTFGRPSRITARVSLGRGQVINLEREIEKSGPSHSKGFLIINGYINGKFAHRQPLSFAASITFEQVYDEVDGDSASSTELYALLSAITDVPLKQGIAVTGSVNQLGEIQAIGGVNEKIEGFYAVCKAKGLTGEQGVMIPKDNVRNLMLKPDVVDAIRDGKFHVWAVSNIEQGVELLTGMPAGRLRRDNTYPEGTLFRRVTDALEAMTRRAIEVNRAAQRELMAPAGQPAAAAKRQKPDENGRRSPRRARKRREDA